MTKWNGKIENYRQYIIDGKNSNISNLDLSNQLKVPVGRINAYVKELAAKGVISSSRTCNNRKVHSNGVVGEKRAKTLTNGYVRNCSKCKREFVTDSPYIRRCENCKKSITYGFEDIAF